MHKVVRNIDIKYQVCKAELSKHLIEVLACVPSSGKAEAVEKPTQISFAVGVKKQWSFVALDHALWCHRP